MASLRDQWKQAKATAVANGLDMKNVNDKANFGPLLDKYEAERESYDKLTTKLQLKPDDKKQKAAKRAAFSIPGGNMPMGTRLVPPGRHG